MVVLDLSLKFGRSRTTKVRVRPMDSPYCAQMFSPDVVGASRLSLVGQLRHEDSAKSGFAQMFSRLRFAESSPKSNTEVFDEGGPNGKERSNETIWRSRVETDHPADFKLKKTLEFRWTWNDNSI